MARTSTASFTAAVIGANFYPFIRASFLHWILNMSELG